MELSQTLVKMAVSPVKADRDAIARIEKEMGRDILQITQGLEDLDIISHVNHETKRTSLNYRMCGAYGLILGSLVALLVLLLRPNYYPVGFGLGFMCGAGMRVIEENTDG